MHPLVFSGNISFRYGFHIGIPITVFIQFCKKQITLLFLVKFYGTIVAYYAAIRNFSCHPLMLSGQKAKPENIPAAFINFMISWLLGVCINIWFHILPQEAVSVRWANRKIPVQRVSYAAYLSQKNLYLSG